MHTQASTVYYIIGAFVAGGGLLWAVARFFIGMDNTVKATHEDVKVIMHNHLPHIYHELGKLGGKEEDAGEN